MAELVGKLVLIACLIAVAASPRLVAHEQGHASLSGPELYQHAIELVQAGRLHPARQMLTKLAEMGDRAAQFELYRIALDQPAVANADAQVLLRRAAGPASPQAQVELAESHLDGSNREIDPAMAAFWFEEAARRGYVIAQVLLAGMLQRGDGVAADANQARFWMQRAAENGSSEAAFRLGKGKPGIAGRGLIEQAAAAGHSGAQRYLGLQLARGGGYPTDESDALNWFTRAAESGDATAMMLVGLFHLQGRGTPADSELAYRWLKRAQINGEGRAVPQLKALEEAMQSGPKIAATRAAMADVLQDPLPWSGNRVEFPANQLLGHGAAFWINQAGYLLSNQHVIERCNEVRVAGIGVASVVASEPENDIAVLKVNHQPNHWAAFDQHGAVEIGAAVNAYTVQHPGSKFESRQAHPGAIRALTRPDLDPRYFRFDASLEPGSSGAPVISEKGRVVGMVVAKFSAFAAYELTGRVGEPVSFALHPQLIREFLNIYGIHYEEAGPAEDRSARIVERLECWY